MCQGITFAVLCAAWLVQSVDADACTMRRNRMLTDYRSADVVIVGRVTNICSVSDKKSTNKCKEKIYNFNIPDNDRAGLIYSDNKKRGILIWQLNRYKKIHVSIDQTLKGNNIGSVDAIYLEESGRMPNIALNSNYLIGLSSYTIPAYKSQIIGRKSKQKSNKKVLIVMEEICSPSLIEIGDPQTVNAVRKALAER